MNFRKNSKWLQWNTWRPGGHWFMKKTWSRKSRVRLPLTNRFWLNHLSDCGLKNSPFAQKIILSKSLPFSIILLPLSFIKNCSHKDTLVNDLHVGQDSSTEKKADCWWEKEKISDRRTWTSSQPLHTTIHHQCLFLSLSLSTHLLYISILRSLYIR